MWFKTYPNDLFSREPAHSNNKRLLRQLQRALRFTAAALRTLAARAVWAPLFAGIRALFSHLPRKKKRTRAATGAWLLPAALYYHCPFLARLYAAGRST